MKISSYYLPVLESNPLSATTVSHKLMLKAGMIRQVSQGSYTFLPLAIRVLQKIEQIIQSESDKNGFGRIIMPTIQPAELWKESDRYDSYGKEMLRIVDRQDRPMLYGPTHEEIFTDLLRKDSLSYKNLPINLYQIHWKFRDEIRPRFGLMRCKEFLMFDGYSADISQSASIETYNIYYQTFLNIFQRMNLFVVPIAAKGGEIGGSLSHEFHVLASTGESEIICDVALKEYAEGGKKLNYQEAINMYAVTDDNHDPKECNVDPKDLITYRGIEIAHIFNFGQKYSKSMGLFFQNKEGAKEHPYMGSYGIGVTRLMAALIEANHDDHGIVWSESVAPFDVLLINLDISEKRASGASDDLYGFIISAGLDVLYDDTNRTVGEKRAIADLIGIPYQITIGKSRITKNECEIKNRKTKQKIVIQIDKLKSVISNKEKLSSFFDSKNQ